MKGDCYLFFSRKKGVYKTSLALALYLVLTLISCDDSDEPKGSGIRKNVWTRMSDFPGDARWSMESFTINGKGYVVGGFAWYGHSNHTEYHDVWEYNPEADEWTRKSDVPPSIATLNAIVVIEDKAYALAGSDNSFWMYDPSNDTWTNRANFPGAYRYSLTAFAIGKKMYVGCGWNTVGPLYYKDWWEYDPETDTWTQMADVPFGERYLSLGCATSQHGYMAFGVSKGTISNEILKYDHQTGSWERKTSAPFPSVEFPPSRLNAVAINDKLFIQAISSADSTIIELLEYDPVSDKWQQMSSLMYEYNDMATMFSVQLSAYLIGGGIPDTRTYSNQVWRYEY